MPIKVAAITGSLRKASVNAGMLRAASALASKHNMEFSIVSADLPLYNQDLEEGGFAGNLLALARAYCIMRLTLAMLTGLPEPVKVFRAQLSAADAVFFSAEEFNYSISGNGAVFISCIYLREAIAPHDRRHHLPQVF